MSENTTELDTPDEGIKLEGNEGDGSEVESGKDKPSTYLGTFKDRTEAEKGLQELQKTLSRYQSERDSYKSEVEKLNSQVLAKLADSITQKGEARGESQSDIEAQILKAAEEIETGGGKAAIQWMSRYAVDAQTKAEAKVLAKLEPMIKSLQEKIDMQQQDSIKRDPEYQARSKITAMLEEAGMDSAKALKLAKQLQPKVQPDRPPIPGNSVGDRARTEDDDSPMSAAQEAMIDAELNKVLRKPMTANEKKQLSKIKVMR